MSSGAERVRERLRPARSIAWPIFALVIVTLAVATAAFFFITFNGPPPMDAPRGVGAVAEALRTGSQPTGETREGWSRPAPPGRPFGGGPFGGGRGRQGDRPLRLSIEAAPPSADGLSPDADAAAAVASRLGVTLARVVALTEPGLRRPSPEAFFGDYAVAVRVGDRWRVVRSPERPLVRRWHVVTLGSMLLAILLLAWPAWALARAISGPLRALAGAAAQARAGAPLPPLPAGGSREVQDLSRAVGAMHARLAGHAQGRTAMLAAIAHDLGTPLSRLAFRVEQLPDGARARAAADIEEMRGMIAAALRFARDELAGPAADRIELGSLLDSLIADMAETGAPVSLTPGGRAVVRGDAGSLRRLFANLVENGVRYGGEARIGWTVAGGTVTVTVDDAGPGVDPAGVEQLWEPFVRGDPSRNRATGGTGLGLAIVRSIVARHGGETRLETRAEGGARATVVLPLSG